MVLHSQHFQLKYFKNLRDHHKILLLVFLQAQEKRSLTLNKILIDRNEQPFNTKAQNKIYKDKTSKTED